MYLCLEVNGNRNTCATFWWFCPYTVDTPQTVRLPGVGESSHELWSHSCSGMIGVNNCLQDIKMLESGTHDSPQCVNISRYMQPEWCACVPWTLWDGSLKSKKIGNRINHSHLFLMCLRMHRGQSKAKARRLHSCVDAYTITMDAYASDYADIRM